MERAREQERGFKRQPRILDLIGSGGMPEEEAEELAREIVRKVRAESGERITEGPAPSPEEVKARREARRRREGIGEHSSED